MASLGEVGQRLKQAREAQGLSLAEVSSRTRITVRHLRAIEEGTEADLPEVFYVRGFLKKYAEVVGLSPTDVADFYKPAPVPTAPLPDLRQGNGQFAYYAAIAGILVGLLVLAWYFQPRVSVVEAPAASSTPSAVATDATASVPDAGAVASDTPAASDTTASPALVEAAATAAVAALPASATVEASAAASPAASLTASAAPASPEPTPTATPKPSVVALTLALKERSWIEVRVEGRLVKEGISSRGQMYRFKGREIEVSAGNAGGVVIFRNGRELGPLGSHGEVVTRTFRP